MTISHFLELSYSLTTEVPYRRVERRRVAWIFDVDNIADLFQLSSLFIVTRILWHYPCQFWFFFKNIHNLFKLQLILSLAFISIEISPLFLPFCESSIFTDAIIVWGIFLLFGTGYGLKGTILNLWNFERHGWVFLKRVEAWLCHLYDYLFENALDTADQIFEQSSILHFNSPIPNTFNNI